MLKKSKVVLVVAPLAIVVLGTAAFLFTMGGPSAAQFEYLKDPQVHILPNLKVLQVEAKGEPGVVGGQAFGLLFKTYFRLKGIPKGPRPPAPRARWPLSLNMPKGDWVGRYAMPVPDNVDAPPSQGDSTPGLRVELTTWEYGDVAEVLHVGPYDQEEPTVTRLTQFIKDCRYEIVGDHEEEYLRGPGMFGKGNPKKYLTIIRYRVKKLP